jgi:hypothetical protein
MRLSRSAACMGLEPISEEADRALYSGSADVHCALIQFSDPVI